MTHLPDFVWTMFELKALSVVGHSLTTIAPPSEEELFEKLGYVNLARNRISNISPAVWKAMPVVTHLRLDENPISLETLRGIGLHLWRLYDLALFQTGISEIPQSLTNLRGLVSLGLSGNSIEYLPGTIGNLTSLSKLYLSHNRIREIPAEIGNLHNLEFLGLANNRLKTLPNSMGDLTSLITLLLDRNMDLSSIPKSLGDLKRLEIIRISNTNIKTVPASLVNNNRLRISIENTPMQRNAPHGGNYASTTTVSYTDTSDPGSTRRRRRRLRQGAALTTSPPSLLDIVSAYLAREYLTLE